MIVSENIYSIIHGISKNYYKTFSFKDIKNMIECLRVKTNFDGYVDNRKSIFNDGKKSNNKCIIESK